MYIAVQDLGSLKHWDDVLQWKKRKGT